MEVSPLEEDIITYSQCKKNACEITSLIYKHIIMLLCRMVVTFVVRVEVTMDNTIAKMRPFLLYRCVCVCSRSPDQEGMPEL